MGDVALEWGSGFADLVVRDDDLASDEGLRTAILLSLFADRRADADDALPSDDGDRRGWWADEYAAAVAGDLVGSRLWLLDRSTRTADVLRLAEEYDREALDWMLVDRVTDHIDVTVSAVDDELLHAITVRRPSGELATFRFKHAWDAESGESDVAFDVADLFDYGGVEP